MKDSQVRSGTDAVTAIASLPAMLFLLSLLVVLWRGLDGEWEVYYATRVAGTAEMLMDAVDSGDMARAHVAISNGADPNGVVPYSSVHITGGFVQYLRPIIVAAAHGDDNMVSMLSGVGADLDWTIDSDGLCMENETARKTISDLLARHHITFVNDIVCKPAGTQTYGFHSCIAGGSPTTHPAARLSHIVQLGTELPECEPAPTPAWKNKPRRASHWVNER